MGTPTNGGNGGVSDGPTRSTGGSSQPRKTWFDWHDARVGKLRATTGEGEAGKPVTPLEHVRQCLGMDEAETAGDWRPTLVFFHWPHEDAQTTANAKTSADLCSRVLNDETSARWGMLFRCVQVDMSASDPALVAALGAGDQPSFVACGPDTKPVANISALGSPSKWVKAAQEAFGKFPEAKKDVERTLVEQTQALEKARAAMKADKLEVALATYDIVRLSRVRVGPQFDRACVDGYELQQKLERKAK
jgi:hypothetical protein